MTRVAVPAFAVLAALGGPSAQRAAPGTVVTVQASQPRVTVLPVFVVPAGAREPRPDDSRLLLAHLRVAQVRYAELLGGRDSFLVEPSPIVVPSSRTVASLRSEPESAAPALVAEVLRHQGADRYTARHVYVVVLVNDADRFPVPGGRPLNGGLGTGAGLLLLSTWELSRSAHVQSTIQHELGHAFGLVHSDNYGEEMDTGRSLMSYNPAHWTNGLEPSSTPGVLLPVEVAALALNRRVFPGLAGGRTAALPARPALVSLPPMAIPGQLSVAVTATTRSGEEYGSAAPRVVNGRVRQSAGPGVTFDASTMWHSGTAADGWVSLDLEFPAAVTLTGVGLHTEHSGRYHRAEEARLEVLDGGSLRVAAAGAVTDSDCLLRVPRTTGRSWRLSLRAGTSGMVVVRGLEFRGAGGEDIHPPMVREVAPAERPCDGGR